MPTSIYSHIEYKHPGSKAFDWFASPDLNGQNYALFALLADVRSETVQEQLGIDVDALFPQRGFPEDAAYMTCRSDRGYELWDEKAGWLSDRKNTGWIGDSWLTTDEIEMVLKRYCEIFRGLELPVELQALLAAMQKLPNARLVFWFD